MSRYFAVLLSMTSKRSYVIAEVAREFNEEAEDPTDSLAGQLVGPEGRIMTSEQLGSSADGRRALRRWQQGNDDDFDAETLREDEPEAVDGTGDGEESPPFRHLRSVE